VKNVIDVLSRRRTGHETRVARDGRPIRRLRRRYAPLTSHFPRRRESIDWSVDSDLRHQPSLMTNGRSAAHRRPIRSPTSPDNRIDTGAFCGRISSFNYRGRSVHSTQRTPPTALHSLLVEFTTKLVTSASVVFCR